MPRKDGLRTNQEIQVDFTNKAHGIYIAAFEREIESKVPDAFKGKPLDYILFCATRKNPDPAAIATERLDIAPLSDSTAKTLADNERFRDLSPDVLEHYTTIAHHISHSALTDTVRMRNEIPVSGVDADYTASLRGSTRTRHASSFKERPSKQSLVSAEYFADEVAEYLQSDTGATPLARRVEDHFFESMDGQPSHFPYEIQHHFALPIRAGVLLNGHESNHYLNRLAETMNNQLERSNGNLARLEAIGAPDFILDHERRRISDYQETLTQAQAYLDKK